MPANEANAASYSPMPMPSPMIAHPANNTTGEGAAASNASPAAKIRFDSISPPRPWPDRGRNHHRHGKRSEHPDRRQAEAGRHRCGQNGRDEVTGRPADNFRDAKRRDDPAATGRRQGQQHAVTLASSTVVPQPQPEAPLSFATSSLAQQASARVFAGPPQQLAATACVAFGPGPLQTPVSGRSSSTRAAAT